MRVLGIVAEYNPFHNGHKYHLDESKKMSGADVSVAVMSGNFTQRGEPAVLSKWERARVAVDCGVDLVLELPFIYACNTAEFFAGGAIRILNGLSCVDVISFGSESGDALELSEAAGAISRETPEFKKSLRENIKGGASFPRARAEAVRHTIGSDAAELITYPNNILATEYIRSLLASGSAIEPITVKRIGQGHSETKPDGHFSSASAIRNVMKSGGIDEVKGYLPDESYSRLKQLNKDINEMINRMFILVAARIMTEREGDLEELLSAGEGLGNKIKKVIREAKSMEDLITGVKSKRYTRTRIQRLITHALLGFTAKGFYSASENGRHYARVLAFNEKGAALLKRIKKAGADMPVLTNINKQAFAGDKTDGILRYDILASDLYNLISGNDLREKSDFIVSPYHKFT